MSLSQACPRSTPAAQPGRVIRLAVPIILANLAQPLMSAVDTGIAGHLRTAAALGGVAVGGLMFGFVFWSFGFLRLATTGFVAQAMGAGDPGEARAVWIRAMLLALLIGLVILLARAPLIAIAVRLIGGSAEVQAAASAYAAARIWSAPATLGSYVILGLLMGRQSVGWALALQLLANIVNAAAAAFIVYVLHAGVAGLGAATAMADCVAFAAGLLLIRLTRDPGLGPVSWRVILDRTALGRLVAVNRDMFMRTLCLISGFGWFAHEGAALGDGVLAANSILLNFQLFTACALDGFAQAAETLVGAAIGGRDREAFRKAMIEASRWAVGLAAILAVVYHSTGGMVVRLLTGSDAVRVTAGEAMIWVTLSPLVSVWCFLLDGVFIGATRGREMRDGSVLALVGFIAATSLLRPLMGNDGLWLAFLMFMGLRALFLGIWLPRISRSFGVVSRAGSAACMA